MAGSGAQSWLAWLFALALAGCCPASAPEAPSGDGSLAAIAWLAGGWLSEDGATEEIWTRPWAGSMLGANRTVIDGTLRHYEHLRIAREEGTIVYHASPVGQAPASFRLLEDGGDDLVFENPAHDFPQRIRYRRLDDARLEASVEGNEEGREKSSRWIMRRFSSP